jgi:putative ABC transport system substrate-binding protein
MRRREFISLLGGAAAGWSLAARAQQANRMRRIGILVNFPPNFQAGQARITAFVQALRKFGWIEGGKVATCSTGASYIN